MRLSFGENWQWNWWKCIYSILSLEWQYHGQRQKYLSDTGAVRKTEEREDHFFRVDGLRDQFSTFRVVVQEWLVSLWIICRSIMSSGFQSYRSHLILPLPQRHRNPTWHWRQERVGGFRNGTELCYGSSIDFVIGHMMGEAVFAKEVLKGGKLNISGCKKPNRGVL